MAGEIQGSGSLKGEDHDRGLHEVSATVLSIARPSRSLMRVRARLGASADDPAWVRPNVAFRIQLAEGSRVYTVREYDGGGVFTFDIVLHDDPSPMMNWSAALRTGDVFAIIGPRPHLAIPVGSGRKVALFADETAIPALYALMAQWPQGVTGRGWVATADADAFAKLPRIHGLDLVRIETQGQSALSALARTFTDVSGWTIWGAGERREMREIRQHLLGLGLAKQDVAIAGYWGRGVSNTEIDERRKLGYERVLADGGTLADYDDLAVEM